MAIKIRKQDALDYHTQGQPGKIEVTPTKKLSTQLDLALAYSPGVAEPCKEIAANKEDVYKYTSKGNLVAVITNGTAVLGLGNIGPEAAKPVMEGKSVLFKKYAGIDSFDIEINEEDPDKFIEIVKSFKLKPRVPVEIEELADKNKREIWKQERNMKVFSFYNPENDLEIIDIMIQDYINFDEAYKKVEKVSDGSLTVSMISIDDLIKLKEIANRPNDRADIEVLKKLKELRNER